MIENRDLSMDDYLAMLRRRMKVILIPVLLSPLAGFLVSYAFPAKYTSQALVLIEEQKVPEGFVKPVVTEDIAQRIATLQQQVLSHDRLRGMIERTGFGKGRDIEDVIDDIRVNLDIEPVLPGGATNSVSPFATGKKKAGQGNDVPGFYVNFTASNPREAKDVCTQLTSMLLEENLKAREQVSQSTTDFLARQLDQAKSNLDDLDSKMATFKKQYMGQLPGDEDNNLKILMGLNSQLDANTQTLNRAQQDKSYTESLLAQQLSAWKTSQSSSNPQTIQQQLTALQSQLIGLQARYTDDYPDVVKTKSDIAALQKKLKEINAGTGEAADAADKGNASEPPEIQQLRVQIHQYGDAIGQATREQKQLQGQIALYQSRIALSPAVEEQYKGLTRDYDTALKIYNDLLAKKSESGMQTEMERAQQGEQMQLLNPANLPDTPSFPNRLLFAAGGLGGGLAIGFGLAMWLELRDKSIRTEQDVIAALDLPVLVAVPWVGAEAAGVVPYGTQSGGNGYGAREREQAMRPGK